MAKTANAPIMKGPHSQHKHELERAVLGEKSANIQSPSKPVRHSKGGMKSIPGTYSSERTSKQPTTAASKPAAPKPAAPSRGTKRKSSDNNDAPDIDPRSIKPFNDDDDEDERIYITETCNQIRNKIRRVIETGEMTIKDFTDTLGVSQNSYRRFMGQNGMKGSESDTYMRATAYFQKREALGLKLPTKAGMAKKRKLEDEEKEKNTGSSGGATAGTKRNSTKSSKDEEVPDVSDMRLEGEEDDKVPIYDTCDTIRRKITDYLKKPNVTGASFVRTLQSQTHGTTPTQSNQLTRFRNRSGPIDGNTSAVYYAAYVYFEKLRIKADKPKSADREEMERIWRHKGGVDTEVSSKRPLFMFPGESMWPDKYGRMISNMHGTMTGKA